MGVVFSFMQACECSFKMLEYDYVSSHGPLSAHPGGQCYTDVAPLACRRRGFTWVQMKEGRRGMALL